MISPIGSLWVVALVLYLTIFDEYSKSVGIPVFSICVDIISFELTHE